jgi:hypothetical protein
MQKNKFSVPAFAAHFRHCGPDLVLIAYRPQSDNLILADRPGFMQCERPAILTRIKGPSIYPISGVNFHFGKMLWFASSRSIVEIIEIVRRPGLELAAAISAITGQNSIHSG